MADGNDLTPPVHGQQQSAGTGADDRLSTGGPSAVVAAAAAALSGGGASFQITFNGVVYDVKGYAPDSHQQYGFQVAKGGTTVAALVYKDDQNWRLQVGLPAQFVVDDHLTLNALTVDLQKGTTDDLG